MQEVFATVWDPVEVEWSHLSGHHLNIIDTFSVSSKAISDAENTIKIMDKSDKNHKIGDWRKQQIDYSN